MDALLVTNKSSRPDFLTSAAVDHALRMQVLYGSETARRYLSRTSIPNVIADRVLFNGSRRALADG